jgi:hypothetical protein
MSDWFTSFANQAFQLADSLAEQLVTQASEAQELINGEQKKMKDEEEKKQLKLTSNIKLPWEEDSDDENLSILSQDLMERILSLSINEENFLLPSANSKDIIFNFNDFIPVAMKLIKIDLNLARIHAKLSSKINEEIFWFNYYCRVKYLREIVGMEGKIIYAYIFF